MDATLSLVCGEAAPRLAELLQEDARAGHGNSQRWVQAGLTDLIILRLRGGIPVTAAPDEVDESDIVNSEGEEVQR